MRKTILAVAFLALATSGASASPIVADLTFSSMGPGGFGAGNCPNFLSLGSSCQLIHSTNNTVGITYDTVDFSIVGEPSGTMGGSVTEVDTVTFNGTNYISEIVGETSDIDFSDGSIFQIADQPVAFSFGEIQGPTPVTEPITLSLFGAALIGFFFLERRKQNKSTPAIC